MNLKDFKVLSKEAYEALSEREQVKYEINLEAYKEAENTKLVNEAVKLAIEAQREEAKSEVEKLIAAIKSENKEELDKLSEANKAKLEEVEAAMKRAKIGEANIRMKGFSEHIIEKLSTDEGEAMIKAFFSGQREKFNMEMNDGEIKALGVPTGGTAPQFTSIVGPGHDDFHARQIIPVFPTSTDLVKFIQYVVDGSATGFATVAAGGQKPFTGYIGTSKEAPVRKIAGLLDVQDELMDDVVGFRAWIAYELPKAYMDAEDLQIFKGDGTGTNLLGLWTQAGAQTFPQGTVTAASNAIDKIIAGITQVRKLKRGTSAVTISAVQWQEILINKSTTKEYTYPIVLDANGVMRIGGVPIFWSNVFLDNEGLVGDFARGTAIFQRKAMTIGYFDQNKDNVEKNVVTIRLEGRIALPIYFPEAFKRLSFTITT